MILTLLTWATFLNFVYFLFKKVDISVPCTVDCCQHTKYKRSESEVWERREREG